MTYHSNASSDRKRWNGIYIFVHYRGGPINNDKRNYTNKQTTMKLIYFHGFGSSGASGTVDLLRKIFPSGEIIAPDIPVDPEEALPMLKQLVD